MSEIVYTNIIRTAKLGFRALGQHIEVIGEEHIPRTGAALLVFNHIGYVDFVYGGLGPDRVGRRVRFMAKRELFDHKVSGPIMRACGHISVDRTEGEASLSAAMSNLAAGELVGIFPEATISRAMEIKELKTGAVRIAARAGVPLIPVVLWGTQRIMTKDHDRDFSRGTAISIRVGEPIEVVTEEDAVGQTKALHETMSSMLAESIAAYPQHEEGAWWVPASYGGGAPGLARAAELDSAERRERAAARAAARAARRASS
jgi:1-acyl-sn-glycerol-3-phosphate acyltransferase